MWIVALLEVPTPDAEVAALAADLKLTPMEAGLLVRGKLPSIVLRTVDAAKAAGLVASLRARKNVVASCDEATVAGDEAMHEVRGFRFDDDAWVSLNQNGSSERLAWEDVTALVRAVHRTSTTAVETSRESKFSLGRAVLTQGVVMSKTVTRQSVTEGEQREPVLYVFRRGGAPWVTSERRARYDGLGADLKPGRLENFNVLVRRLRERLPAVPYDERLMQVRPGGDRLASDFKGAERSASNTSTIEVLAHLVAQSLTQAR